VPRARYCIYRGMWAELPPNKHNPAERNPRAWTSDCPTFTTDARMQKGRQIVGERRGGGEQDGGAGKAGSRELDTAGGGPVEAVWWIKEDGIMAQWRVKGTAYILGRDIESSGEAEKVRQLVKARMREGDEKDKTEHWSWEREITAHFGNVSPGMRGT
jgi:pyridoxamine 5'-phosphate oxidase